MYTLLSLLLTSMAGYAFARFEFFGRSAIFTLVIATLTIPYFVVVIPQYILVAREFTLTNSYMGVVLPLLANSLGIFFMRQNFLSLPQSLLDRGARGRRGRVPHLFPDRAAARQFGDGRLSASSSF